MPYKHIQVLLRSLLVASREGVFSQDEILGAANALLLELGLPEVKPVYECGEDDRAYEEDGFSRLEVHTAIRGAVDKLPK